MLDSNLLLCLYTRVRKDTSFFNNLGEEDMKKAIEQMHKVYQASPDNLTQKFHCLLNFNEVTYRCAYLFKYAPFHTALSYNAINHALTESSRELGTLINSLSEPLKLCSLGGGPGADMLGVLAAMHERFGLFHCTAKLVDIMSEWELTFWSIVDELRQKNYGSLSESVSENWFNWSFITSDLTNKMSRELSEVLRTADVVTMVKFVSAAACKETSTMIEKIFRMMKPGAFLFFIDNAAGGFKEIISSAALKEKFVAVSTPLKHHSYTNKHLHKTKYGYRSCYESKVAVQLLMKSGPTNYSSEGNLTGNMSYSENFHSSPVSVWRNINEPRFQNSVSEWRNINEPCFQNSVSEWRNINEPRFQNFRIGPKPVDNFTNEYETFAHDSVANSFSSPSKFSPKIHCKSFESGISLNSSPQFSSFPNRSNRAADQSCDSMNSPKLHSTSAHDSGYSDESFNYELSQNFPMYNNSPHFRAQQRLGRPRIPMRETGHSFYESESFCSTPVNNLPQYSMQMPHDENFSLTPIPYRQNLHQKEPCPRIPFKRIDNSMYNQNPMNYDSNLHQPRSSNRRPFGTLQHSVEHKRLKGHNDVSAHWNKSCKPRRFTCKPSENALPSLQSSSENYKAPRKRTVLMPRFKPY